MRAELKCFFTAAALAFAAGSASAATIDFTDAATAAALGDASGPGGGYVVTGSPVAPNSFEAADNGCALTGLACEVDGLGIKSDEIGTTSNGTQFITVTFNKAVRLVGMHTLDLFIIRNGTEKEVANITLGDTAPGAVADSLEAVQLANTGAGVGFLPTSIVGTQFTFWASPTNDGQGVADFALAGLEVAAVPVPAGVLLFGTALGGFGLMRRRQKKLSS